MHAEGHRALELRIPAGGGTVYGVSPSVAAQAGASYLARFMLRVTGLSQSRAFEGGQAGLFIQWLGALEKPLLTEYVAWTYYPMDLSYRDQILRAPPGTVAFRVTLELRGNAQTTVPSTAWFDDVAVCRYTPPPEVGGAVTREWSVNAGREILNVPHATAWFYLAGVEGQESSQAERVRDEHALLGAALHAKPGVPPGIVYHSAYTVEQSPGLFRVCMRVRTPPHPPANPDAPIVELDAISSGQGPRGHCVVRASDFKKLGDYEEFGFDIVKPSTGWLAYRVSTPGQAAEFWLDHVRVVQLLRFSDPDLLTWYPGLAGASDGDATLTPRAAPHVLVVEGLLGDRYRCREAVQSLKGWDLTAIRTELSQAGATISAYPTGWRDLRAFNVVVLANASLEALGPEQRYQLRQFVEMGGGLLILGGKAAFGNGGICGSFLEDVIPVAPLNTRFDIDPNKSGPIATEVAGAQLGLEMPSALIAPWVHRVTVKPGATVLARQGQHPFLVAHGFGRGRVVCMLGTPYGCAPKGMTMFIDWKDLPAFMARLLRYTANAP